ncbi:MAG: RNA 3'-terminal phosphate cyclase [Myxococcales bacterium]|nr:RNA 3'-terminal phosphate cyclase [Myxococcales bacterium]
MIEIDGAEGEGGGQVLRSSLALAMWTGQPFRIRRIRANRRKPGLLRQHLTGVRAAATLCGAEVSGDTIRSEALTFRPGPVKPGAYRFEVGTAGSANLVLQTVLPPLLVACGPSELVITGGTHNPSSPPTHFLQRTFVPLLGRMGAQVELTLPRWGFFPAGGGEIRAKVTPVPQLQPLELAERGRLGRTTAVAVLANLKRVIGNRELKAVGEALSLTRRDLELVEVDSDGPGNVVLITCEAEHVTQVFSGFGRRGVPAARVAEQAAAEARAWQESGVPVGPHLADQLMIPLVMAGSGSYLTGALTEHATTNAAVIERFTGRALALRELQEGQVRVSLTAA